MALVKKHTAQVIEELPTFDSLEEADEYFENSINFDHSVHAVDQMMTFNEGPKLLISKLVEEETEKNVEAHIAAAISKMDGKTAPIESIMDLLKLDDAYVRNLGICMLQDFGDSIKYYIVKFLIGDDRDLRIFAINVLGDVNFAESRDMLVELLDSEEDINVAMTAVDYLGEIGEEEDIPLLEDLKTRFHDDAYVSFGVDKAIKAIKDN
ncbi:MAG: HEAT repeat domain-containing protein [Helicobacteraceae bacterium]|nr:HEAT repeat domain-containing protein [Helicobacteraceae bacterium]